MRLTYGMLHDREVEHIVQTTFTSNGCTYWNYINFGFLPKHGYVVGGAAPVIKVSRFSSFTYTLVGDAVRQQWSKALPGANRIDGVGTWIDGGDVYVDAVTWVPDLDEAMALGRERNEIALWDLTNAEAVIVS